MSESINTFKERLDKLRHTREGFLWINLPSPRPHGTTGSPVRPHKLKIKGKIYEYKLQHWAAMLIQQLHSGSYTGWAKKVSQIIFNFVYCHPIFI